MSEIKFACPHCRQHIACDDAYCGARIDCPGCQRELFVPRRAAFVPIQPGNLALELPVASKMGSHAPPIIPAGLTDEQWAAAVAGNPGVELADDRQINWPVFFAMLLAPAALTMIGMTLNLFELVMFATFIGSGAAGIHCGRMLARRLARDAGTRALLTVVLSLVFGALSFVLCFVGCALPAVLQSRAH